MEESGAEITYPTLEQVIDVNRRMVETSGGRFVQPDNFQNRAALEYILVAISSSIFEHSLFESLKQRAAALAFEIISSHVFIDGNKRTGIHIAWEFLRSINISLSLDHSVEDVAVQIAAGSATRDNLLEWLHDHQPNNLD